MSKNIVLVGLSGSGKSTIGNALAGILKDYSFVDTDDLVVRLQNRSINNIFALQGEEYFRNLETQVVEKVSQYENQVISTGGGIVLRENNLHILKKRGTIFYLKTSVNCLISRLDGDTTRPLLKTSDIRVKLENMLKDRALQYEKADFIINTDDKKPLDIAEEILRVLNDRSKC